MQSPSSVSTAQQAQAPQHQRYVPSSSPNHMFSSSSHDASNSLLMVKEALASFPLLVKEGEQMKEECADLRQTLRSSLSIPQPPFLPPQSSQTASPSASSHPLPQQPVAVRSTARKYLNLRFSHLQTETTGTKTDGGDARHTATADCPSVVNASPSLPSLTTDVDDGPAAVVAPDGGDRSIVSSLEDVEDILRTAACCQVIQQLIGFFSCEIETLFQQLHQRLNTLAQRIHRVSYQMILMTSFLAQFRTKSVLPRWEKNVEPLLLPNFSKLVVADDDDANNHRDDGGSSALACAPPPAAAATGITASLHVAPLRTMRLAVGPADIPPMFSSSTQQAPLLLHLRAQTELFFKMFYFLEGVDSSVGENKSTVRKVTQRLAREAVELRTRLEDESQQSLYDRQVWTLTLVSERLRHDALKAEQDQLQQQELQRRQQEQAALLEEQKTAKANKTKNSKKKKVGTTEGPPPPRRRPTLTFGAPSPSAGQEQHQLPAVGTTDHPTRAAVVVGVQASALIDTPTTTGTTSAIAVVPHISGPEDAQQLLKELELVANKSKVVCQVALAAVQTRIEELR